jgi:polysaccharide deacetylase 2 family uncharacterized protein YibQ
MNRREFLTRSACCVLGCGMGASPLSLFAKESPTPEAPPQLILVIDDFGYSLRQARRFLDLDIPLTYAVLPRLSRSREVAAAACAAGHEVMLHQPMEPLNASLDPGPGALYTGTSGDQVAQVLERNLDGIAGVRGVNNHMGSLFTASSEDIRHVLAFLRKRGLFFLDSLTTSHSVAYATARSMGLPAARRRVFIDNRPEEDAVLGQLHHLAAVTGRKGSVVGIGHPHRATASALARFIPCAVEQGLRFAGISALV